MATTQTAERTAPEMHVEVMEDNTPATRPANSSPPVSLAQESQLPAASEGFSPENRYFGIAELSLSAEQQAKLMAPMRDDQLDILPTGEVYPPAVHHRYRLNEIVGPGAWALYPTGKFIQDGNTFMREYTLVIHGHFIAEAVGETDWHPNNERMSKAAACEAVKSNALVRCCKDLGIGLECWDKRFQEDWRREHCVKVFRDKGKPQWRRRDAEPWWDEKGIAQDSPAGEGAPRQSRYREPRATAPEQSPRQPAPPREEPRQAAPAHTNGNGNGGESVEVLEGVYVAGGEVLDVPKKGGEGTFKKYVVKLLNGWKGETTKSAHYSAAANSKAQNKPVRIEFTAHPKFGPQIVNVTILEADSEETSSAKPNGLPF